MSWFTDTPWVSAVLFLSLSPSLLIANALEPQAPTHNRVQTLQTISVTATRLDQEVPNVGIEADTLSVENARKIGQSDLHNVLRSHPLLSTSSEAGVQGIFMTGLPSQQIRILVDGIDIKDAISTQGASYSDALLLDTFGQIDILSAGMSTLYGADAIGGIISFKSDPEARFFRHKFRSNYTRTATQWQEDTPIGDFTIQHASLNDNTFSAYEKGIETDPKHVENWGILHRIAFKPIQIETVYKRLDGSFGLDESLITENNKTLYSQQDLFGSTAKVSITAQDDIALHYSSHRINRDDNFRDNWTRFFGKSETLQLTHTGYYDTTTLISGYERYMASGGDTYNASKYTARDSLFGRGLFALPYGTFGVGYRQEWVDASSIGAYDLSLGTQIEDTELKASLSTGYRFPSISEWNINAYSGNNIGPESSRTSRLSLNQLWGPISWGILYFDTQISNKIDFDDTYYVYFNQSENFISRGFQYSISLFPVGMLDALDLIYVEQQAQQGGEEALRIPNKKAILRGSITHGDWQFGSSIAAVSGRTDGVGFPITRVPLDSYVDLSASIHYKLSKTTTISLEGQNLLGQKIELVKDFHTVDTAFTAGIQVLF